MSDARAKRSRPATADEFLAWPGDGRTKHYELVDGEVRAMWPASAAHGVLQATLAALIRAHLQAAKTNCVVITEPTVQPRLRANSNVRVPDLGVTCSPVRPGQIVIEDPILLVEILSPFNRSKTWTNVWAFTTIPSLQEIVVLQSTRIEAQILRPSAGRIWPDNPEVIGKDGILRLDAVGLSVPLAAVYADLTLD